MAVPSRRVVIDTWPLTGMRKWMLGSAREVHVNCESDGPRDLDFLALANPRLERLVVSRGAVRDFSAVGDLKALESLSIDAFKIINGGGFDLGRHSRLLDLGLEWKNNLTLQALEAPRPRSLYLGHPSSVAMDKALGFRGLQCLDLRNFGHLDIFRLQGVEARTLRLVQGDLHSTQSLDYQEFAPEEIHLECLRGLDRDLGLAALFRRAKAVSLEDCRAVRLDALLRQCEELRELRIIGKNALDEDYLDMLAARGIRVRNSQFTRHLHGPN